jgi:hypothetical protein
MCLAGLQASWTEVATLENLSSGVSSSQLRVAVYNHNSLLPDGLIGELGSQTSDVHLPETHATPVSLTGNCSPDCSYMLRSS